MTPITSSILAAAGLAVAGYPLLQLTTASAPPPASTPQIENQSERAAAEKNLITVYANLRYTGQPTSIKIYCAGRILLETKDIPAESKNFSFTIPADTGMMEILTEVRWSEGEDSDKQQVITLTLEPSLKASQSKTCWTQGDYLHDILLFVW